MTNILIFGYGNLSRGDDALGPLLIEYIQKNAAFTGLDLITDFQLQIEHALDLEGRDLVLFVDAAVDCDQPFELNRLAPEQDKSYTTHAMSPASVLSVFQRVVHKQPPPCFLFSVQALSFELGDDLSDQARVNLSLAEKFIQQLLAKPELDYWMQCVDMSRIGTL